MEKIKIKYDLSGDCYLATAEFNGKFITGASIVSYEKAKERLIELIKKEMQPKPKDEVVEI